MKIAVCISGHTRCYKDIKHTYDKFINKLQQHGSVDVFVAVWDKKNTKGSWASHTNNLDPSAEEIHVTLEEVTHHYNPKDIIMLDNDFYNSLYSPLNNKMVNERSKWNNDPSYLSYNGVVHGFKQYFCMYQSLILKKKAEYNNNKLYDIVFRIRPDFFFIELDEIIFDIEPDTIYSDLVAANALNDMFFYGDSFTMDRIMSAFLNVSSTLENWWGCATSFDNIQNSIHPSIKRFTHLNRVGILPNDPIDEWFLEGHGRGNRPHNSAR